MRDNQCDLDLICNLLLSYSQESVAEDDASAIEETLAILRSESFGCVSRTFSLILECLKKAERKNVEQVPAIHSMYVRSAREGTLAAYTASTMQSDAHCRVVELKKSEQEGLGFNVMGGREQNCPLFVARVIPNGPADRSGRPSVLKGDQIVCVNGINVEDAEHERCVDLLKQAKGTVQLVVRYAPELQTKFERMCYRRSHSNSNKSS